MDNHHFNPAVNPHHSIPKAQRESSASIEKQVQEFLNNGGEIEKIASPDYSISKRIPEKTSQYIF